MERALAPYARALTPEGLDEARREATFALATHPDIGRLKERVRTQLATQGSGVQATRARSRLEDVARRKGAKSHW